MAEYMIADADNAVKLPDSVSFEQGAPLMCAGVSHSSPPHLPLPSKAYLPPQVAASGVLLRPALLDCG